MNQDTGGPAFPVYDHHGNGQQFLAGEGMTLRDYFAAKAMQSVVLCGYQAGFFSVPESLQTAVGAAYGIADAMLEERSK